MIPKETLVKKSIPLIEKGNFCRYFATMLRSGTPLLDAIDILSGQTQNKTFSLILKEIGKDLEKGKSLGATLGQYPKTFDPIFLTVIKAGEESGTLDKSLDYLGKQILADYYLVQKVKGALLYPLVIIVTMIIMAFLMVGIVIPRIAKVFLDSGLPLPPTTKIIFTSSLFVEKYFVLFIAGFLAGAIGFVIFMVKGRGKQMLAGMLPRLPVVKKIFSDLDIARFGRILGTLLQSGVPIVSALKIATESLTLPQFRKLGPRLEEEIIKGKSLKESLKQKEMAFPKMVAGMIAIGEESGSLDEVLFDIANFYDQEVDTSLKNFTTILEPVLMVAVGIGVAVLVLSIIAPIYSLIGSIEVK